MERIRLRIGCALLAGLAGVAVAQQCALQDSQKSDCYPWDVSNSTVCAGHGCCWSPSTTAGVPWCFYPILPTPTQQQCAAVTVPSRADCHPEPNANQNSCQSRGCCWSAPEDGKLVQGVAYCYFPHTDGYTAAAPVSTPSGFRSTLTLGSQLGPYRNDVPKLQLNVSYLTQQTMRFTISDPNNARWVPPVPLVPQSNTAPANTDYSVSITQAPEPFGITITRKSTGAVLFDSRVPTQGTVTNGLIFEDQYLEISTVLPQDSTDNSINIYGLAEHITPLRLASNGSTGQTYTLLARDQGTPVHQSGGNTNLYASMPFYMVLDTKTGDAFGVFLFNSNAMDVVLQPNALTYRAIGGILDVYVFSGPSPSAVIQQYTAIIGTPYMPPRWALGFHLCRWGYNSLNETQAIWSSMLAADMPQEVQWNDIDYMQSYLDFTTDSTNYPIAEFKSWVDTLHSTYGQKYMMIYDPGISAVQPAGQYAPWDSGIAQNVFINDKNNDILIGKVWPGLVGFPDFFAPNTSAWWASQFARFHAQLPFDGAWIDMNEPSNFCDGQCEQPSAHDNKDAGTLVHAAAQLKDAVKLGHAVMRPSPSPSPEEAARAPVYAPAASSASPQDPKYPPYLPGRLGGATLLETKTIAMSARQYVGMHYNAHNLYGWSEGVATHKALETIRGKRSMVISRSTFATSGVYNGHWLGDNAATWDDLYYSIPGVLNFNMLGIPLVGADTCGFGGPATTPELCTRWMQLGAFVYGFYRNHNTDGKQEQAPSVFADPYKSCMRNALNNRLTILPYLYSLFYMAHASGATVTRPIFFEFPADANVAALDTQVMLGPALMVSPVIIQGATTKQIYFPAATWYDWFSGSLFAGSVPGYATVPADLCTIPVHIRGGYIVPTQDPNMTTVFTSLNPFHLTVALDPVGMHAQGEMYIDDGDSIGTYESKQYTLIMYAASASKDGSSGKLQNSVVLNNYAVPASAVLSTVRIFGVMSFSSGGAVTVNGSPARFQYDSSAAVLTVSLNLPPATPLQIMWQ